MKDGEGSPYDCDEVDSIDPVDISIVNAWQTEFDGNVQRHVDYAKELGAARLKNSKSGTIDIFKTPLSRGPVHARS